MATELGKAYVQIVASADGLGNSVTKSLNKEAGDAGSSSGSSFGGSFVKTIGKIVAVAGIGKVIADSINIGASLEQSLGGVDAIFGDAANIVKKNAEQAFATAGVSANTYMEGVTSFAASLLQSTGGNAEEAANVADMAFRDMSDNANRFGTDIGSIQAAYQGFAKQNYTMLDNLKLGYGGTKTEMERLLADAQALSGVEYNIENLDDVYEAIHVIQGELNVTGTTAAEAASTFSGSLAMMKAAGENLLGNLALGEDIKPALSALIDSVMAFAGNALGLVGNILKGIPDLVMAAIPQILSVVKDMLRGIVDYAKNELPDKLREIIPEIVGTFNDIVPGILDFIQEVLGTLDSFIDAGFQLLTGIITGLLDALPDLITGAIDIITNLLTTIIQRIPEFLNAGISLVQGILGGILGALPELIDGAIELITQFIEAIIDNLPTILEAGVDMLMALLDGIVDNLPKIAEAAIKGIIGFIGAIGGKLPEIIETGITLIGKLVTGLIKAIPEIVAAIPKIIKAAVTEFKSFDWIGLGKSIIEGIVSGIKNLGHLIGDTLKSLARNAWQGVKNFLGIGSPSRVFADQIGQWIPAGIAMGIEQNAQSVRDAMNDISAFATGAFTSDMVLAANARAIGNVASPGGSGVVINNNITVDGAESPEDFASRLVRQLQVDMRAL